jgi:hypothetical protein
MLTTQYLPQQMACDAAGRAIRAAAAEREEEEGQAVGLW